MTARPSWLGPELTGAAGELAVLRGLLAACHAYTCSGIVPPVDLIRRVVERLRRLADALRLELAP